MRTTRYLTGVIILAGALVIEACGGGGSSSGGAGTPPITLSLSSNTLTVGQDGAMALVTANVTRPAGNNNSETLSASSLPVGITAQVTSPGNGSSGTISFTAAPTVPAGTYTVEISATDGTTSANSMLTLTVAVVATVSSRSTGKLQAFMSTSFQPADWDYTFFTQHPDATATLNSLNSHHIRLQAVDGGVPQRADQSWDFSELDAVLDQVVSVADKSPEFQIAVAPPWMNDSQGHLMPSHFQDFAEYCANLVKYYNTTSGFTDAQGKAYVHGSFTPITWWGIFNEPNINGLSAADYTTLYNLVVPAMQGAGSAVPIKFVAVELSDFGNEPQNYLPTFVSGVRAPVDAVATHYYSSCNQSDADSALMDQVLGTFVPHVLFIYSTLKGKPALAGVPVWVTENNVNADFSDANGFSVCNPGQKFVTDQRGSSAFFAAWRPYVFSQLAQAGTQSLHHWDFDADPQYGEVDFSTGNTYLSYWVDYYLAGYYTTPPGAEILQMNITETAAVEVLATRNGDGSVVVMLADHAIHTSSDNNGAGDPRTVILDVSALGTFSSANQLTLDATTDVSKGPVAAPVTQRSKLPITLNGYGVTFLTLKP